MMFTNADRAALGRIDASLAILAQHRGIDEPTARVLLTTILQPLRKQIMALHEDIIALEGSVTNLATAASALATAAGIYKQSVDQKIADAVAKAEAGEDVNIQALQATITAAGGQLAQAGQLFNPAAGDAIAAAATAALSASAAAQADATAAAEPVDPADPAANQ